MHLNVMGNVDVGCLIYACIIIDISMSHACMAEIVGIYPIIHGLTYVKSKAYVAVLKVGSIKVIN